MNTKKSYTVLGVILFILLHLHNYNMHLQVLHIQIGLLTINASISKSTFVNIFSIAILIHCKTKFLKKNVPFLLFFYRDSSFSFFFF